MEVDLRIVSKPNPLGSSNGVLEVSTFVDGFNRLPSELSYLSVLWSTGATTDRIENVSSGVYEVTLTNSNTDCEVEALVEVYVGPSDDGGQDRPVEFTATGQDVGCGSAFGSIRVDITNTQTRTATLSIAHDGGKYKRVMEIEGFSGVYNFDSLPPGIYRVTLIDLSGKGNQITVEIGESAGPEYDISVFRNRTISCFGGSDGELSALYLAPSAPGTEPPAPPEFSYVWNTGATTRTISGLTAGTYSVSATEVETGCVSTASYVLGQPSELRLIQGVSKTRIDSGSADGYVNVIITGGTTPYSPLWDNGSTGQSISALSGGTYTLTVTDANGCTVSGSYTVVEEGGDDRGGSGSFPGGADTLVADLIGTSGVLHVTGDPDFIALTRSQDLRSESMLAMDTVNNVIYRYVTKRPTGNRWDTLMIGGSGGRDDADINAYAIPYDGYTVGEALDDRYLQVHVDALLLALENRLYYYVDSITGSIMFDTTQYATKNFVTQGLLVERTLTQKQIDSLKARIVILENTPPNSGGGIDTFTMTGKTVLKEIKVGDKITGNKFSDLARFLYYRNPTIALNPSPTVVQRGTVTNYTFTASTDNAGGAALSDGRIERNGVSVSTFGGATSGTHNFIFSPNAPSGNNSSTYAFQAKQNYNGPEGSGTISSSVRTVRAVYAVLYGTSTVDYVSNSGGAYAALNKLIQTEGNKSVVLQGGSGGGQVYMYFAVPLTWSDSDLSQILDGNGFDVTGAFTRYVVNIATSGLTNNTVTQYALYRSNSKTAVNATYTFKR